MFTVIAQRIEFDSLFNIESKTIRYIKAVYFKRLRAMADHVYAITVEDGILINMSKQCTEELGKTISQQLDELLHEIEQDYLHDCVRLKEIENQINSYENT